MWLSDETGIGGRWRFHGVARGLHTKARLFSTLFVRAYLGESRRRCQARKERRV
jgi:hypothetical protein